MRVMSAVVFVALMSCLSACGDSPTLPRPSPLTRNVPTTPAPPAPPAPPASGVSTAVLVMSNFTVTEYKPRPEEPYYYNVKFVLTEITGKSGATITNVQSSVEGQSDNTGPTCWREVIRVEPGGTLDAFDKGWDALSYCAPFVGSRVPMSSVTVLVSFDDDDGRPGTVTASVTVPH